MNNEESVKEPKSKALHYALGRGFFDNCTDLEALDKLLLDGAKRPKFYIGFDLTAPGLHVGHLSNLMFSKGMIERGFDVIILLGGGTTYIGDPSGKEETRKMLDPEVIRQNKAAICRDIMAILCPEEKTLNINHEKEVVFESANNRVTIVDNFYWLMGLGYIDFLRDVGIHFSVNRLIKMETFKKRLDDQKPLSFIEFNYPLLQAYDFYYLNQKYDCDMQIGGSDQWGNIVRGVELIAKMAPEKKVFGYTLPLIVRSDGKKMGKSEDGAVWLHKDGLSDNDYMQYFRNVDDRDVSRFLRIFTELSEENIVKAEEDEINKQKIILALEATKICRGDDAAVRAMEFADKMFGNSIDINDAKTYPNGIALADVVIDLGLADSKSEFRRLVASGGVKVNSIVVKDPGLVLNRDSLLKEFPNNGEWDDHSCLSIAVGKKKRRAIRLA